MNDLLRTTTRLFRTHGATMIMAAAVSLMVGLAACDQSSPMAPGETGVPSSDLTFLHFAPEAGEDTGGEDDGFAVSGAVRMSESDGSALLTSDTSFVATRGEPLLVELFYEPANDTTEVGDRFLRFELGASSLAHYPPDHPRAGAAFESGDTVTISIRASADTLLAQFGPSGLQFDSDAPAELEVSYRHSDFEEQGTESEEEIDLWKQEAPGELWYQIGEIQDLEADEIEAILTSFTRYAMAI